MGDEQQPPGGPRPNRRTSRGYGPPRRETPDSVEPTLATFEDDDPGTGKARRPRHQPAVDIDLVHERRTAPLPDQKWTFVEVWTRNTIYALDSRLVCIAVIDQANRKTNEEHPLLHARLVGGQSRDGEGMELSHPFPRPGSEAVFEQARGRQVRFSQTSTVTRVVLRLRVLTVSSDHLLPAWEEISGVHEVVEE